jgi:hypothetical protein
MKRTVLIGLIFLSLLASAFSAAAADQTTLLKGKCTPESHIAEGTIGEDLTKLESRFFCDSAVITFLGDAPNHVLIQFADSRSLHGRQIGFAGTRDDEQIIIVHSVYLETGRPTAVVEGACKFFRKGKDISALFCAAKIDEGVRRTVPLVAFDVALPGASEQHNPTNPPIPKLESIPKIPYDKSGVVNCSLPGTIIEFFLNGQGGAQVTRIDSNYAPFLNAVKQNRLWSAKSQDRALERILVLDNGHNTRIIIRLPDGKGMAFSADGGVSDILCQVLVTP